MTRIVSLAVMVLSVWTAAKENNTPRVCISDFEAPSVTLNVTATVYNAYDTLQGWGDGSLTASGKKIDREGLKNGTAEFGELCGQASLNTTYNPAEVEACSKLFVQAVVAELKKGMNVDLGPIGKLRPSCTSGWKETAEELTMECVKTHVNYDASDDIKAAIAGASLSWAKAEDGNVNENPALSRGARSLR